MPDDNTPAEYLTDDELRQCLVHAVLEIGEWLDDRGTFRGGRKADRLSYLAAELQTRVDGEIKAKNEGVGFDYPF